MTDSKYFATLRAWLEGGQSLPEFFAWDTVQPAPQLGGFLGLERCVPVHESLDLPAEDLEISWQAVADYITGALEVVGGDNCELRHPDGESRWDIREALGEPPRSCWPLYIISVGDGADERVVYIGKTSASTPRFSSGHTAITKLHRPEYAGLEKRLYQGCVMLLLGDDYLPLEWVRPRQAAIETLRWFEAQLIFEFQPELNSQAKNYLLASRPLSSIHIQNFMGPGAFLDGRVAFAPK